MSDKYYDRQGEAPKEVTQAVESHMVYELKQKMEYHLMKLIEIKQAIDAVNRIR